MHRKVLFCTVGGSHEPILTGVKVLSPDYVYFFCTENTPGGAGSEKQISGQGKVIKAKNSDEKASLPNIPTQLGLQPHEYEVVLVAHDDLDLAYQEMVRSFTKERGKYPEAALYADYTGGTKTMTAALVIASLDHRVELHVVTGKRANLHKVADGTQWSFPANVQSVRLQREIKEHLTSWFFYAFGQASRGVAKISPPSDGGLRQQYTMAMALSNAFDAWDRFDHQEALRLLSTYKKQVAGEYAPYLVALHVLATPHQKREPALIWDLWLNAQRRAAQGRFDDAVARVYRMVEWTAQWMLRTHCEVDCSDLPEDFIPEDLVIHKGHSGKYQAPLHAAWKLVAKKVDSPGAQIIKEHEGGLLHFLGYRNGSILAHGYTPVDEKLWSKVTAFLDEGFLPFLKEELKTAGLRTLSPQLPNKYIWL